MDMEGGCGWHNRMKTSFHQHKVLCVCASTCVCVCVHVKEREGGRKSSISIFRPVEVNHERN